MATDCQDAPEVTFTRFATVVLDVSIDRPLDYGLPEEFVESAKPGMRVVVPVRGKPTKGTILSIQSSCAFPKVQPLTKVLIEREVLTEDLFTLANWMVDYYCTPLTKCLSTMLPSSVKKEMKEKEQLFIKSALSMPKLTEFCAEMRVKFPKQGEVLDVVLMHPKGILLTELLEKGGITRAPVESLIKKGILIKDTTLLDRSLIEEFEYFPTLPKKLNPEQQKTLDAIVHSLNGDGATHLIHGITGSGKTEIYLQAIEHTLSLKKSVILLVPEIALTTQTIERLKSRFQERLAILHSRLSHGERFDAWHAMRKGDISIIVGARSAIFSPLPNLGLVIVDEEHESSYKQCEDMPTYHARDIAVLRAKLTKGVCILGSATPSLESYYNTSIGKYKLHTLHVRAGLGRRPSVQIVNMALEKEKNKGFTLVSDPLLSKIEKRLKTGEQSILFLNRRGYFTCQVCTSCSKTIKCNHCDVSLTYHKGENILSCHICGFYLRPPIDKCPTCNSCETLKYRGPGTEQLERTLHAIFPQIRTLRMDGDTTKHKGSHDRLFKEFKAGKADLLIGTQMIAKGLHFPNVTLVGVIGADATLNIPDFRSNEFVFQLITQVSGRSGRDLLEGEVVIQTHLPDHPIIQLASEENYLDFFRQELEERKAFAYPPFTRLIKITFTGKNLAPLEKTAQTFHSLLSRSLPREHSLLLPLTPCGYAKIKDRHRFQCLLKTKNIRAAAHILTRIPYKKPTSISILYDVDPMHTW